MTTGNDIDGAEFEAFLQGKGELARKLQTMPQPAPSAELDAAILAQIEVDLVRENALPEASNDPFIPKSWRAPLATAACAALVFVAVMWDDSLHPRTPDWRGESSAPATVEAREPAQAALVAAAPVPRNEKAESVVRDTVADKASLKQEASRSEPVAPAPAAASPILDRTDTSAKPVETVGFASGAIADAVPPPVASSDLKRAPISAVASAVVSGTAELHELQGNDAPATGPVAKRAASADVSMNRDSPAAWLRLIEYLLNAGASKNALAEWDKFGAAYPNHKVPKKLEAQIKTLKK